eukprot:TRINITY_DN2295_c0_g1_i6.p1 TRINITY_DN2295_c0_g1~~TRINITY_DN2295_c0_g1_i6.p1  ORF type:complete len:305 (-),score=33.90 TRINITY_DN2295_c0_g1_i6:277-1191(-)
MFGLDTPKVFQSLALQLRTRLNDEIPDNDKYHKKFDSTQEDLAADLFSRDLAHTFEDDDVKVIIILDEFDRFAKKRQTLFYNLLEIYSAHPLRICILAVTSHLNYLDLLEKRIKSRFMKTQILFSHPLRVGQVLRSIELWLVDRPEDISWNNSVAALMKNEEFNKIISEQFSFTREMPKFAHLVELALTRLNNLHPYLALEDFRFAYETLNMDCKVELCKGISQVELAMLVSIACLENRSVQVYTFDLIYECYSDYLKHHSYAEIVGKVMYCDLNPFGELSWEIFSYPLFHFSIQILSYPNKQM